MSVTFYAPYEGSPEVNLSNVNARLLLEHLGLDDIDGDLFGNCPAHDFLGRVLMAVAISPKDEGVPLHEELTRRGARSINAGRAPGYLQDRLGELRSLAECAIQKKLQVVWA